MSHIKMQQLPAEHAVLRIMAGPSDMNAEGDIFGGWLMSQVDIAGSIVATRYVNAHVVTVAVNHFHFIKPVLVRDIVSIYGHVQKVGRTSITIGVEIYIERKVLDGECVEKVAEAEFVYVRIDEQGKPLAIQHIH